MKNKELTVIHFVNELTLAGGTLLILELLKGLRDLGCKVGCATIQDGVVREALEKENIKVWVFPNPWILFPIAEEFKANVLHGHTAGGGSLVCKIARHLRIVGGEHIHSMVPGSNPEADFEIAQVEALQNIRPKATLIRCAYNPQRFTITRVREEMQEELGIPPNVTVIGRSSHLDKSKGVYEFVQVLAQIPEAYGLMVGEGKEYESLRRYATQLGCSDRLIMPGVKNDLGNYFNAIDIICFPTLDEVACGGVHEPLFLQKPVVCYPIGGIGEVIQHRKSGLHAHNISELIHWTKYLITNPSVGKALGEAGWARLKQNGQDNPLSKAQQHLDLYRSLRDQ